MTLLELCEPYFQEVCALLRSAGEGGATSMTAARNRLKDCLTRIGDEAYSAGSGTVSEEFHGRDGDGRGGGGGSTSGIPGVRRALVFLADDVIENSQLPFAAQWALSPLSRDKDMGAIVNFKQQFFNDLDVIEKLPAEKSRQRLAVYYTCLGLGFGGVYRDNTDELQTRAQRIYGVLGDLVDRDVAREICPAAYDADEKILYRPVRESLVVIGWVLVVVMLATLGAYYGFYKNGTDTLNDTLKQVMAQ